MKRIALFAHYDRDGIVDDYVVYYLRELRKMTDRILFASDCDLRPGEALKLAGLADVVHTGRHGEYDFGSWKRCFEAIAYALDSYDELIITNDLCFAPVYPLAEFFDAMQTANCDFWGPTYGTDSKALQGMHVNSYFMVFRRSVLDCPEFLNLWKRVAPQPTKNDIVVRYEFGLSRMLQSLGFTAAALAQRQSEAIFHPEADMPWVRTDLFKTNLCRTPRLADELEKLGRHYPIALVDSYVKRICGTARPAHYFYKIVPKGRVHRLCFEADWHLKTGKPGRARRHDWIKLYVRFFGVPVFAFAWPVRRAYY